MTRPLYVKIHHRYGGASILHEPVRTLLEVEDAVNWLERSGTEVERVEVDYERGREGDTLQERIEAEQAGEWD